MLLASNPRALIVAEQPHLAGASTAALLAAMEQGRQRAVEEGRYLDAQDCLDRIHALTQHEGEAAAARIKGRGELCEEARAVAEANRAKLFEFTKLWETTMNDYDAKAERLLRETQQRHDQRFEEEEELLRSELGTRRPHFSRTVIDLRELLQRKVRLQDYREAEMIKRELEQLEAQEIMFFDEALSAKFAAKTKTLKAKFAAEIAALKQRIRTGREELLSQRRLNYANLVQRHANSVMEAQQKTRTEVAKEQKALERQVAAMITTSGRKQRSFPEMDAEGA